MATANPDGLRCGALRRDSVSISTALPVADRVERRDVGYCERLRTPAVGISRTVVMAGFRKRLH